MWTYDIALESFLLYVKQELVAWMGQERWGEGMDGEGGPDGEEGLGLMTEKVVVLEVEKEKMSDVT